MPRLSSSSVSCPRSAGSSPRWASRCRPGSSTSPAGSAETAGPVLVALAAAGAALVLGRAGAALLDLWRTSRLARRWSAAGRPLAGLPFPATRFAHEFPVAAVFGLRRGRLFLADGLLRALSPEELDGVVAHEAAHRAARDNLKRLLLRASPDLLALSGPGARLRQAFEEAAESEADDRACARVSPLVLARALLKVAALVPPGPGARRGPRGLSPRRLTLRAGAGPRRRARARRREHAGPGPDPPFDEAGPRFGLRGRGPVGPGRGRLAVPPARSRPARVPRPTCCREGPTCDLEPIGWSPRLSPRCQRSLDEHDRRRFSRRAPAMGSSNPVARYLRWLHLQWPAGTVERLPEVQADGSTGVAGLYVVGDLTGVPLLKFSSDSGARAVQTIVADPAFKNRPAEDGTLDLVIVGAGVAGMAAALEARRHGLRFEVLEASEPFSTIVNFPKGKPIFTYPRDMTPAGELQFSERSSVKEGLVEELRETTASVTPRLVRVERVARDGGRPECPPRRGRGAAGAPRDRGDRPLGQLPQAGRAGGGQGQGLEPPARPEGLLRPNVLVVGGGDSALEAAIALGTAAPTSRSPTASPSSADPSPRTSRSSRRSGGTRWRRWDTTRRARSA